ncbi:hypothetical protein QFZ30_002992 [Arthrobacter pascens]|nr:hypothetical protein [Arthrobacter pascens]
MNLTLGRVLGAFWATVGCPDGTVVYTARNAYHLSDWENVEAGFTRAARGRVLKSYAFAAGIRLPKQGAESSPTPLLGIP